MSYQVLARKWRPKTFSEVIGQDHITRTLKNSVKTEKIAHAYLLTGTRGVGKTTIARIFAKAIRCLNLQENTEPCLTCDACLAVDRSQSIDYIEIDGASNNSVEDVRELIENVQYLPTSGKFKVYVVDEVHMLTVNAFNALLKTLEEPPAHVVFIFATTDPQKLLGTVLSRCQRLDFKNVSVDVIKSHLEQILSKEEIKIETPQILDSIAKYARGSVRDSLSILDQVISLSSGNAINEQDMSQALGLVSNAALYKIVTAILEKDKQAVSQSYKEALDQNVDLKVLAQQVLEEFYKLIEGIDQTGNIITSAYSEQSLDGITLTEIVWLYESLSRDFDWAIKSLQPEQGIAFVLTKTCLRDQVLGIQNASPVKKKVSVEENVVDQSAETQSESVQEPPQELSKELRVEPREESKEEPEQEAATESGTSSEVTRPVQEFEKNWDGFLSFLALENRALSLNVERGNITASDAFTSGGESIEISFQEGSKIFHDVLVEGDNRQKLVRSLEKFLGRESLQIHFQLLSEEASQESNFKSTVEIQEDRIAEEKEQQRQEILNNKFIKDAEKIFNTKVDKIVLSDKG